ncbi:MAG: methyltransferase, TIGR04325 family [Chitinophagaceae bacterium]
MKNLLKLFTPPIVVNFIRKFKKPLENNNAIQWKGNYPSWAAAAAASEGYDQAVILKKVKASTLKVKTGEAVYERDSFIFDEKQYSWPLLALLLKIAAEHGGQLNIIDFGGSLGSTYFQNRDFLHEAKIELNWRVVEQAHFVKVGNEELSSKELSFYDTLKAATDNFDINVILLSGVLQCIEYPDEVITLCKQLSVPNILVDRTAFVRDANERITVQHVPEWIYKASYPCRFFNEQKFIDYFSDTYHCEISFDSFADIAILSEDGKTFYWKGFYFTKKN